MQVLVYAFRQRTCQTPKSHHLQSYVFLLTTNGLDLQRIVIKNVFFAFHEKKVRKLLHE